MVTFESFSLPEPVLRALADMGFVTPSPIQADAIPLLLEGRDLIGQARTGTGKTAAFGLPLISAALDGRPGLVLVPTRELAQQVAAELTRLAQHTPVRALALYGGASFGEQARALQRGCDIVVATPGRLRDHLERGTMQADAARVVVLDEADEMLKMGFVEEVEAILDAVGPERQTALFSATLPDAVRRLAQRYLDQPEHVLADDGDDGSPATSNTEQFAIAVEHREKTDTLVRLLAIERPEGTLVFRHTRESVDELVAQLRAKGIEAQALHGGMAQGQREDVLERLRRARGLVVVATNVAARGLDVACISLVVNFDAPAEVDAYVHRIGRTGRAGREGTSCLFVTPSDRGRLRGIERVLGHRLEWREVPTDEQVHEALARNTAEWLRAHADAPTPDALAAVDALLEEGRDARELAAGLLARLAPHEGLAAPPLEPRRPKPAPRATREGSVPQGPHTGLVINVGKMDGVRPADLVAALAREGGVPAGAIGRIDILPRMSVVELPAKLLEGLDARLARTTIRGRSLRLRVANDWTFRTSERGEAPLARR